MQCLHFSSGQSYGINIVESTMTMTEKTRYITPPFKTSATLLHWYIWFLPGWHQLELIYKWTKILALEIADVTIHKGDTLQIQKDNIFHKKCPFQIFYANGVVTWTTTYATFGT